MVITFITIYVIVRGLIIRPRLVITGAIGAIGAIGVFGSFGEGDDDFFLDAALAFLVDADFFEGEVFLFLTCFGDAGFIAFFIFVISPFINLFKNGIACLSLLSSNVIK